MALLKKNWEKVDKDKLLSSEDFLYTTLPAVGKKVLRMGIAGNFGIQSDDVEFAAEQGANYWLWGAGFSKITKGVMNVLRKDRDHHVVAMLGYGIAGWQIRLSVENALRTLNTDYLDVFKIAWLGRTSRYSEGIVSTLLTLKEEGKIRAIGTSIHDRQRAGNLVKDSAIDVFMIRYNAKHPGAETDIFPHLNVRNPAVISYTALAWGQLIKPFQEINMLPWPGEEKQDVPPLTPELCYRFVLSNQHVHIVLTGPKSRTQLEQNLKVLQKGPLIKEEMHWVREYGKKLKGRKRFDLFEMIKMF